MAKSICVLSGENGAVSGILRLSQLSEDAPTIIQGDIKGLAPGKHAISIHVFGNLSDGPTSCGAIFNPFGKSHGAPEDEERMLGDLGNVTVGEDGSCTVHKEDKVVKLIGPHSVIGRSFVIHAGEDDCGRGGHELSLVTGNSGARVAAGVIGIST
eukprot:CAMPEP_0172489328 /NCGR_PEP_ID=MMETSP1066-20121228/19232_1 /TAXON_ID=671091 /ORGANISM="Coscinodiscus wailesii, Strain CCMP2513" /LENGTH=154 /DNA_ID=CAMNT_0013257091 /DNA_START=106 /DNA_END=570 /DNA_ORIENTATION=+